MSESFSANSVPVPAIELPFDGLKLVAEPVRPVSGMPLEPSLEQMRAVKGALGFLAALLAFYGEIIEQGEVPGREPFGSESSGLQ